MATHQSTRTIRDSARVIVRALGMLGSAHGSLGVTNSQVHALVELEREKTLGVAELSRILVLDKSTVSRLVDSLVAEGLVTIESDPRDGRRKRLALTAKGRKKLLQIHQQADERVEKALANLSSQEIASVQKGLELYARALKESLV